jgi:hypothetical protein
MICLPTRGEAAFKSGSLPDPSGIDTHPRYQEYKWGDTGPVPLLVGRACAGLLED